MENILSELYGVVQGRKAAPAEGSYTCYLFEQGLDKILKKIGEEAAETIIAAKNLQANRGGQQSEALTGEICDLIYHIIVMAAELDLPVDGILDELDLRSRKIGNLKKMRTVDKNS